MPLLKRWPVNTKTFQKTEVGSLYMQRMGCKDLKVTDFPSIQFCSKCYFDNKGVQAEMNTPLENISDLLLLDINILPLWFVRFCSPL